MIVDWHAHVYPPDLAGGRRGGGDSPLTIEKLLEAHERAGIDLCVVSNTMHHLRDKSLADALSFVQLWNAYGAEIQQKYSGRIVVFSSTLPCGGAPFVKELERAVTEYGLKGVLISSSHQGAYPDDDEARSFFELVTRLRIPVMMHAPSIGFGEERMGEYGLASSVGRPFDECLSLARLIVRGVFEQFQGLKFVGCHLGGGICEVIGRMDYRPSCARTKPLGQSSWSLGAMLRRCFPCYPARSGLSKNYRSAKRNATISSAATP